MEKGQSEVTNKIRSSIKKKLAEISDFVDDELPEYIMILIANQRSKTQIEKDLSLFLRNDTVNFTNWLWDLLNSLKSGPKSNSSLPKSESSVSKKETEIDEDAVVLDFDPDERETDFLSHEDTNDSFKSKSSIPPTNVLETELACGTTASKSLNYKLTEKEKTSSRSPVKVRKSNLSHYSKETLSSAVIPVQKKVSSSTDEYDPAKPEYERSSYTTSSRKYAGPAALQANKLLLKAVDDATKSVLEGKSIEDNYKPTPIKVLTSKQSRNPLGQKEDNLQKKSNSFQDISVSPQTKITSDLSTKFQLINSEYQSDILFENDYLNDPVATHKNRTICLKEMPLISQSLDVEREEYIHPFTYEEGLEIRPKSPHFIVTLDGISSFSLKRKLEDDCDESMVVDDNETIFSDEVVTSPEKKLKLNERCKYWPACKNSDNCAYHHPTIPCKCFPDCKFGDKCLYIHPNCKFDALCSRKDCPFTHASKRKLPLIAVPVKMIPVKSRKIKPICKFYPKCTSKHCQFMHPKLCRYGTECRLPACLFSHFPVPSRSQLKWQATIS